MASDYRSTGDQGLGWGKDWSTREYHSQHLNPFNDAYYSYPWKVDSGGFDYTKAWGDAPKGDYMWGKQSLPASEQAPKFYKK